MGGRQKGWGNCSVPIGEVRWLEAMLDESKMTVAGAIQCRYPTEFNLEKSTFYLENSPILKKVSWFFFFSLSHCLYLKCALLSFCFSKKFTSSFSSTPSLVFTKSRPAQHRLRTLGQLHRYPWGQCPQWAGERSSVICIRSPSCPSVLYVSVQT